jgi:hypothetical protein
MAEAQEKTKGKRGGPKGPRTPKPMWLVVEAKNADGSQLNLDANSGIVLSVRATKNSDELVQMLTVPGAAAGRAIVQATLETARANPGEAAQG